MRKGIINQNKYKQTQSRFKLRGGQITADKHIISEKFNDFFVSIGQNLAHKIPNQAQSPLSGKSSVKYNLSGTCVGRRGI